VYSRTSRFVPVTENWNAALALSSGDYVLMLGDDDGLLPGYIERMRELVEQFDGPDVVHTGAWLLTYPGVDPERPDGFLAPYTFADFFGNETAPFIVSHEQAVAAVRRAMSFRLAFSFNMQLSLISRSLIEKVRRRGEFFQSPFPDYYATCAAFIDAERIVADPRPEVVIGVTPKSYGFFHVNNREQEGRALLEAHTDAQPLLPGTNINDGWLGAMEAIAASYGQSDGLRVNRRRYRMLQAANVYSRHYRGQASEGEVADLRSRLGVVERMLFGGAYRVAMIPVSLLPERLWSRLATRTIGQFPDLQLAQIGKPGYANILDVYEREVR
jgi:glycosyltransferase involved in cell wall biosynthesis